jgi:hypothetical protein
MTNEQALGQKYLDGMKQLVEIAVKAQKHGQNLKGHGFYANKFHEGLVALAPLEAPLLNLVKTRATTVFDDVTKISNEIKLNIRTGKSDAFKKLDLLFNGIVLPALAQAPDEPVVKSEAVLPMQVIKATRGYLEKITVQANVCYEYLCFDACAVMIRKLVELLIIQVFEKAGKAADIKNAAGDYLMLGDLITKTLADQTITLGRTTKRALPEIKELGDRSAHTRNYVATKADVDKILSGLRVAVEDLLHLGGLR